MELDSNEAIKPAIAGGLGLSVLSRHRLALEGEAALIEPLDVAGFPQQGQWYVAHLAGMHLSAVAAAFIDHLLASQGHPALDLPE